MDKFLNFYSKYPWVAIIIVLQWAATAYVVVSIDYTDIAQVMLITFVVTVIYAYFGFKIPKA